MSVFIALAIIANTYFIQHDYFDHRDTVDITVVVQVGTAYRIKPADWIAVHAEVTSIGLIRKACYNSITCKRPRDRLIQ
jgi:hypothetical protein